MTKESLKKNEYYNNDAIMELLRKFKVGSKKWLEQVKSIAESEHGPSEATIYEIYHYTKEQYIHYKIETLHEPFEDERVVVNQKELDSVSSPVLR